MIKNFAIFKKDNKGDEKKPTHSISTKIGEDYVDIGACWTKQGQKGAFLSCKLSDAWVNSKDNTKSRKSYVIVAEDEIELPEDHTAIDPVTQEDLNAGDIPF